MSPNLKRPRKILSPPLVKGFRPYGPDLKVNQQEPVSILFEEYEALRLCDFDMLNHHQASEVMGVSRPTFTRIYSSVRQKIARAFVEGRQIAIEGGKVYFDTSWLNCNSCGCFFNNPGLENEIHQCPLCGSADINVTARNHDFDSFSGNGENKCFCPTCGKRWPHFADDPCNRHTCPDCNTALMQEHIIEEPK